MPKIKKITSEEQKALRIGIILIIFAILLVTLVVKIDQVGIAIASVGGALTSFCIGIIIAYMLNVLVTFFESFALQPLDKRIKLKRWLKYKRVLSILLSLVVAILLVCLVIFVILPELSRSISGVFTTIQLNGPIYFNEIKDWLEDFVKQSQLNIDLNVLYEKFNWESIFAKISEFSSDIFTSIVNATVNVTSAIFTSVVSFIFSIYFLFGKEKLLRHLKTLLLAFLPKKWSERINNVASLTNYVFFQFVRGQLVECLILGVLCYLGMSLFRFDYALLISSIMTITALIPIFGAYIGAIAGAFILLLEDPIRALWFLVFIVILQQLEGNLIYPRVVGHSIGLPAVWTMFAVLFWGSLFGIPGILLGTPFTAVIYRLLRRTTSAKLKEKGIDPNNLEERPVLEFESEPPSGQQSQE